MFKRLTKSFPPITIFNIAFELFRIVMPLLSVLENFLAFSIEVIFLDVSDVLVHSKNPICRVEKDSVLYILVSFWKIRLLKKKEENQHIIILYGV